MSSPMRIVDPPAAIAASHCLAARARDPRRWITARHPSRCGWCDYPTDVLAAMVRGFNEAAGTRERTGTFDSHEARLFAELRPDEQLAAVLEAQQLVDEPPPAWGGGSAGDPDRATLGPHRSAPVPSTGSSVSGDDGPPWAR